MPIFCVNKELQIEAWGLSFSCWEKIRLDGEKELESHPEKVLEGLIFWDRTSQQKMLEAG